MLKRSSFAYFKSKLVKQFLTLMVHPPQNLYQVPGYLSPCEGRFLFWLASKMPPNGLAVEIGSFKGKSTSFLASGMTSGGKLACIDSWGNDAMPYDPKESSFQDFQTNTRAYRNAIECHQGISADISISWKRPIDLLFIDGDHSYGGCSSDIKSWVHFVRKGGWIAFHDSGESGVSKALSEHLPNWVVRYPTYADSIFAFKKLGDRS